MANVAINGMGRIGRAALKIIMDQPALWAWRWCLNAPACSPIPKR